MNFNSLVYLLFLPAVTMLYWVFPYRARLWLILLSSLVFYAFWSIPFLAVMLLSVLTDYVFALKIAGTAEPGIQRRWLLASLAVNLGLLFFFKYTLFIAANIASLSALMGVQLPPLVLNIMLPVGISFYTFQTLSYTLDVYYGLHKPERDFVLYACYVTYFPQLVAGPILRAKEVIPQFVHRAPFAWHDIVEGVRRIALGLFLKVVLADNIAVYVDDGFGMSVAYLSALDVWTLAFLFGFQIYFDFSAYSHIALGSARLMGLRFPENFNFPYMAASPREFWNRWHISLSSWVRDYLYLPLAGLAGQDRSTGGLGKVSTTGNKGRALLLTWIIMGLWHGGNWTFVVWGLYHACVIFLYRGTAPWLATLPHLVRHYGGIVLTLPLMMLAWIPFRAANLADTGAMWAKVLNPAAYRGLGLRENAYLLAVAVLLGHLLVYFSHRVLQPGLSRQPGLLPTWLLAGGETLVFSFVLLSVFIFLQSTEQFIYFQF